MYVLTIFHEVTIRYYVFAVPTSKKTHLITIRLIKMENKQRVCSLSSEGLENNDEINYYC